MNWVSKPNALPPDTQGAGASPSTGSYKVPHRYMTEKSSVWATGESCDLLV